MNIRIVKPVQGGTLSAITSKSAAHRLLICSALANKETFLRCPQRSQDIDATAGCLQAMTAGISYEKDGFYITPLKKEIENTNHEYTLDCGESGSTLRFLLPVCGALGLRTSFHMGGRLPSRPLSGLYEEMEAHGCTLSAQGSSPLICEGKLKSGNYSLPGNISSQFVSGLLFALPMLEGGSNIRVTGVLESRPYVNMTLEALNLFNVKIEETENQTFLVKGGQSYHSPKTICAEGDWSNAAFWLSAGAVGEGSVTCIGLNINSCQGDRAITKLLTRFGAQVSCEDDKITVSPGALRGIDIDAADTPDLVPVLAAVASVAQGETVIRNAGRLRIKESDRLHTVATSLSSLGANIKETEDSLIIQGQKTLSGGETESFGDHRIAMTAVVISAACSGHVVIKNAQAVNKSYPGFFEDFKTALGGVWEREG
jgi:3-phosphoshikimate 1-carboxyvinyltransferase